jgi:serine-type D-Ala-D-Ala carboxypeptidase (penicillin-binding protein 5/6)
MPARTREKPRFKLDPPPPTQSWAGSGKRDARATRKLSLVTIETAGASQWSAGSRRGGFERLAGWLRARRGLVTLGQRRRRRRLAWIGAGLLTLVVAVVSVLLYNVSQVPPQLPGPPLTGAQGGATSGGLGAGQTLHFHAPSSFASLTLHTSGASQPPAIQAKAAFLYDATNGWALYEKNPDQPRSVASLTKIMTLLLATDSGSMDQSVTVGTDAAALVNSNNSYMGLSAGEQVTMQQLLFGLMLPGGNDAALAIADAVSGDAPAFIAAMNRNAQELGLSHTSFVSADGLDSANISSARDMAELTTIVIQQPGVAQITSTRYLVIAKTTTHKTYTLYSTNDLLPGGSSAYAGVNGVKTGYTTDAGYCMAFSAVINGRLIVGVILGDPSDQARVNDARALLNWGYAQQ